VIDDGSNSMFWLNRAAISTVEPFPNLGCTEFDSPYPHQKRAQPCSFLIRDFESLPKISELMEISDQNTPQFPRKNAVASASEKQKLPTQNSAKASTSVEVSAGCVK
jgi:hypothetical protein